MNDALVQLLDLREYTMQVIDDEDWDYSYAEREHVDIHVGMHWQKHNDIMLQVGRDIVSGYINHYIVRPGGDWEICDDIPSEYG